VNYRYDYLNRLVARSVEQHARPIDDSVTLPTIDSTSQSVATLSTKEHFIHDGNQIVLQFADNELAQRNFWGSEIDELLAVDNLIDEETLWILADHLNSTRKILKNENGQVSTIASIDYDSFGNKVAGTNPIKYAYTGKFFDEITDLQWNLNRWYDPQTGQWMTQDPIGFNGGDVNLYRYVGNDVINMVDTEGLDTTSGYSKTTGCSTTSSNSVTSDKLSGNNAFIRRSTEVETVVTNFGTDSIYAGFIFPLEAEAFAKKHAKKYVNDSKFDNEERFANALRHSYWQAMVTYEYGLNAAFEIERAHEIGEEGTPDSLTDMHNNRVGQIIGLRVKISIPAEVKNKREIYSAIIQARVLQAFEKGQLIKSNADPRLPKQEGDKK
jgi:RHS repeat-associated protein